MGQAQRRKQGRKTQHIRLVGEAAEPFDQQMEHDRQWFEQNPDVVQLRPAIPGEWDAGRMAGMHPPCIGPSTDLGGLWTIDGHPAADFIRAECVWTASVDVGRAIALSQGKPPGPASGWRARIACVPPLTPQARREATRAAIGWTLHSLHALKRQAP